MDAPTDKHTCINARDYLYLMFERSSDKHGLKKDRDVMMSISSVHSYRLTTTGRRQVGSALQPGSCHVIYSEGVYGGTAPSYHDLYCQQGLNLHGGNRF